MGKILKKYKHYIAVILGIALIAPMLMINSSGIEMRKNNEKSEEDLRVASEISNMTGMEIEEILEIKAQGRTWNEVIEILKANGKIADDTNNEIRNTILMSAGISEETLRKLKEAGYKEEEIMNVKLLIERVVFQLAEIAKAEDMDIANPKVQLSNDIEDIDIYINILNKIDLEKHIFTLLMLQRELESVDMAIDEYLCALQLDLNLEKYFESKESYLKEKSEKTIGYGYENILTMLKIEETMMENLQRYNEINQQAIEKQIEDKDGFLFETENSTTPEIPYPKIESIKVINPNEEIMKELESINPNNEIRN